MKTFTRGDGTVVVNERRNGNGKLSAWLLGIFAALSIGWVSTIQASVLGHATTLASLTQMESETQRRLGAIEGKLDLILGWQRRLR